MELQSAQLNCESTTEMRGRETIFNIGSAGLLPMPQARSHHSERVSGVQKQNPEAEFGSVAYFVRLIPLLRLCVDRLSFSHLRIF